MGIWKKLFGGEDQSTSVEKGLPLASEVGDDQSIGLIPADTIYALIAVVPQKRIGLQSESEIQDFVWALYEASNPKMCTAIKNDRDVIRAYYFESPNMKVNTLLEPDHWFEAMKKYRIPDQYSSVFHFLNISDARIRFRLKDPNKPNKPEFKFDVAIPPKLKEIISLGPSDVTMITVFTSNESLCIPTMWPLRPKQV